MVELSADSGLNRRMKPGFAIFLLLLAFANPVCADFWPEFRGPKGDGHADKAEVPLKWSGSRNIRWKTEVPGKAWSSPVVAVDRIYITTAVEDSRAVSLRAGCYGLEDGKQIWEQEIFSAEPVAMHKKNSQASPTPIYEEGKLYVHFGHFGTACLDAESGKIVWTQTSLPYKPVHGTGGSPVVFRDKLIYSCDGAENPFVVALNKSDGSVAWKTPRNVEVQRTFSFSTPLLIEVAGSPQVVVPGSGAVVSYDPETGKEIWRCLYGEGYSVVPRPLYHNGKIYVCSGFNRASLLAIRADGKGDVTDTHIVWKNEKGIPRESSPIIVGNLLYINDDQGILSCFNAETGEELYRERLDGAGGYSSSPVYASGYLFFHNGEGITTVVKPGEKFEKVEENKLGEYGLSSFAVISDGFIVRTEEHLFRIGE